MKLLKFNFFFLFFLFFSCQKNNYSLLNFSDNDIVISKIEMQNKNISEIEIIIKLDERVKGALKVEDFYSLCTTFGELKPKDEYITKGQNCIILSEINKISNQNNIELLDINYLQNELLILKLKILPLELKKIDEIYIYFHLRDNNRLPILRYNSAPFFYKSEKAKSI